MKTNNMESKISSLIDQIQMAQNNNLSHLIQKKRMASPRSIIVLDDDPTGTQTVSDVPVLTEWDTDILRSEFEKKTQLFFILTNSRSLPTKEADELAYAIGRNIEMASRSAEREYILISRSDSTLRGHYPGEVNALLRGLNKKEALRILVPAFFEGGRITFRNVHYVREGKDLIPVGETPFAQDKSFGFASSDLKEWVEEKTNHDVKANEVYSFGVRELREGDPDKIVARLQSIPRGRTIIVNAVDYYDLQLFVLALLDLEKSYVLRTAASFVAAIAGTSQNDLLSPEELAHSEGKGGITVVGSYVPKSTQQLKYLWKHSSMKRMEISIEKILQHSEKPGYLKDIIAQINDYLSADDEVVLYTSRKLISGSTQKENLNIGNEISLALTEIVSGLTVQPRYFIAKGGITSSDIMTKALHVKRASVLGQILPGVPVWELGEESKYPGMRYVVFPGNVGEDSSLLDAIIKLNSKGR